MLTLDYQPAINYDALTDDSLDQLVWASGLVADGIAERAYVHGYTISAKPETVIAITRSVVEESPTPVEEWKRRGRSRMRLAAISPSKRYQMVKEYQAGATIPELAEKYSITHAWAVSGWAADIEAGTDKFWTEYSSKPSGQREAAAREFLAGPQTREDRIRVMRKYGFKYSTFSGALSQFRNG